LTAHHWNGGTPVVTPATFAITSKYADAALPSHPGDMNIRAILKHLDLAYPGRSSGIPELDQPESKSSLEAVAKLAWLGAVTQTVRVVRQGAATTPR
jgi:hypothetical protein